MAGTYGYTPEEMRRIGRALLSTKTEIGTQVTAAQSDVNGLIGSGFTTSQASGRYSEQFADLAKGLNDVASNLEPLGNFLIQYADAVERMDQEMASQLGG